MIKPQDEIAVSGKTRVNRRQKGAIEQDSRVSSYKPEKEVSSHKSSSSQQQELHDTAVNINGGNIDEKYKDEILSLPSNPIVQQQLSEKGEPYDELADVETNKSMRIKSAIKQESVAMDAESNEVALPEIVAIPQLPQETAEVSTRRGMVYASNL